MKKNIFCISALLVAAACIPLFALDGQVITVTGKAECQNASGAWKPLKAGDILTSGTMISTGFKSEATLKLGASILTVRALTRMTLNQLVEKEDTVETELYLEVGNVKAEVNSLDNKKNGFTVKSPVATASVRGTILEVGDNLVVTRGSVQYVSRTGQKRTGTAGQQLDLVNGIITNPAHALQTGMHTIRLSTTPITETHSPIMGSSMDPPAGSQDTGASNQVPTQQTVTVFSID